MNLENKYYTPKQIQEERHEQGYPATSLEHATRISRGHADVLLGVDHNAEKLTPRMIAAVSLNAPELVSKRPLVYLDNRTGLVLTKQEAAARHEQEV